jgi:hypothetical protein
MSPFRLFCDNHTRFSASSGESAASQLGAFAQVSPQSLA